MGQHASVMDRPAAPVPARTTGRAPLRDILTDPVVLRIAVLAVGVSALLLAVAVVL